MIVCHCAVVNCRTIAGAVDEGAGNLNTLCARTGAGQDCGRCVFTVKRILNDRLAANAAQPAEQLDGLEAAV